MFSLRESLRVRLSMRSPEESGRTEILGQRVERKVSPELDGCWLGWVLINCGLTILTLVCKRETIELPTEGCCDDKVGLRPIILSKSLKSRASLLLCEYLPGESHLAGHLGASFSTGVSHFCTSCQQRYGLPFSYSDISLGRQRQCLWSRGQGCLLSRMGEVMSPCRAKVR